MFFFYLSFLFEFIVTIANWSENRVERVRCAFLILNNLTQWGSFVNQRFVFFWLQNIIEQKRTRAKQETKKIYSTRIKYNKTAFWFHLNFDCQNVYFSKWIILLYLWFDLLFITFLVFFVFFILFHLLFFFHFVWFLQEYCLFVCFALLIFRIRMANKKRWTIS